MPIITATELKTLQPELSSNVKDAVLTKQLFNSEILDLRPELGEEFFRGIEANPGDYNDLLDGSTYTHSGDTFSHPGIKEVLAQFAYARYIRFGSVVNTPLGAVVKQGQDSREASKAEKDAIYNENRRVAFEQWLSVKAFLNRKSTDYPLWCGSRRVQSRFSKITR